MSTTTTKRRKKKVRVVPTFSAEIEAKIKEVGEKHPWFKLP